MNPFTHMPIKLGHTPVEQTTALQAIKDAMCQAMITSWETGTAAPGCSHFAIYSEIYLEAQTTLHQLQNI